MSVDHMTAVFTRVQTAFVEMQRCFIYLFIYFVSVQKVPISSNCDSYKFTDTHHLL